MSFGLPAIAGTISTVIFALSSFPMLYKAAKSKELGSYSLGNILLSNLGNLIHSIYIFSMPMGPIWLLHSFYLVTTAMMLIWYLKYEEVHLASALFEDSASSNTKATYHLELHE